VRYDIWGVDTKIGNEMESSCKEGRILISVDTKETLEMDPTCQEKYVFEENEVIDLPKLNAKKLSFYIDNAEV